MGVFTTQTLLTSVGVSRNKATPGAVAINWILKVGHQSIWFESLMPRIPTMICLTLLLSFEFNRPYPRWEDGVLFFPAKLNLLSFTVDQILEILYGKKSFLMLLYMLFLDKPAS